MSDTAEAELIEQGDEGHRPEPTKLRLRKPNSIRAGNPHMTTYFDQAWLKAQYVNRLLTC